MMSPHPLLSGMGSRSAVDVALRLLRVCVGIAFVLHGWGKVRDVSGFLAANGVPVFLGAAAAYMHRPLLHAAAAMLIASLLAAPAQGEETAPARPSFERLRQDEDWSVLCDPARRVQWFDAIKCVPLDVGRAVWLSLGGEVRERYEYTRNPLWGEDPQDKHGVFLQRYVLHSDLHVGPHLRLFGQISSALEDGRAGPPSPSEENRLDLQQGFLDLSTPLGAGAAATLRVGRQELRYGSARLVDVREGPNVRRKFDGARVRIEVGGWQVDGIAVRPSLIEPGVFDDRLDDAQALWGAYAVRRSPSWLPFGSALDLYYLGYQDEAARFDQGTAQETRHTVGLRLWGERSGWDWTWEFMYQFGRFGRGDIRAWSAASETGYTAREAPWSPRLGLSANIASGDRNPADRDLQTFNPLFPRGNYFSELALLGPRNFFNLHPSLTVQPTEQLSLTADIDFFWRLEHADGIYSSSGRLLRSGRGSDARYVSTEFSLNVTWQIDPNMSLTGIYAHSFPGAFVKQTGPAKDIDFLEITLTAQF